MAKHRVASSKSAVSTCLHHCLVLLIYASLHAACCSNCIQWRSLLALLLLQPRSLVVVTRLLQVRTICRLSRNPLRSRRAYDRHQRRSYRTRGQDVCVHHTSRSLLFCGVPQRRQPRFVYKPRDCHVSLTLTGCQSLCRRSWEKFSIENAYGPSK